MNNKERWEALTKNKERCTCRGDGRCSGTCSKAINHIERFVETLQESSKCGVCGMGKIEARGYRSCEDCNRKQEMAVWGTKEQWEIATGKKPSDYMEKQRNAEKRNKSK